MELGILTIILAGMSAGSIAWPLKVSREFKFEHSWFIGMLTGLIIIPWFITLVFCPNAIQAYRLVPVRVLLLSNMCSMAWGIAMLLYGISVVRIGAALTGAILTGAAVCVGVTMPMIIKGSGLFADAPDITSTAGKAVIAGMAIMLIGVVLASLAGFAKERLDGEQQKKHGGFLGGMLMCIIAGVISCGAGFSFIYSQGPIVAAMKAQGASDIAANVSVWAVALLAGALINILHPAFVITRGKSWKMISGNWKEIALASIIGVQFCASVVLEGKGMLLLGTLGASVGIGIHQALQIIGNAGVGFASGEWKGIHGRPRRLMLASIIVLVSAAVMMAYGNTLVGK